MTRMGLDLPKQDVDGLFDSWDPSGGGEQHLVSKQLLSSKYAVSQQ